MRRTLAVVVVLLSIAPAFRIPGSACGDKFLLVGRGARFNRAYAAIYPATILLYAPPGRAASGAILDPKFQASLTQAGHRVEVSKDESEVGPFLRAGRFDLLLTDIADAEALRLQAATSPSQPSVMPILFNPTKAEAEAVKARYRCDFKSSDRPARYLTRIDEEMQTRLKQRSAKRPS